MYYVATRRSGSRVLRILSIAKFSLLFGSQGCLVQEDQMKPRFRKALQWGVALVVLLPIVLYTIAVAINHEDRAPSPAALRLEEVVRAWPPVEDGDNAYFTILGLSAVKEADPAAVGRARADWLHAQLLLPQAQRGDSFPGQEQPLLREHDLGIQQLFDRCKKVDAPCVAALGKLALHRPQLEPEAWRRERYAALLAHTAFREQMHFDPSLPMLQFSPLFEGQKLHMLEAWSRSGNGDAAGVKALLEADLRFWRMVLAESDLLITKLMAAHAVTHNLAWTNVILRRLPPHLVVDAMPDQLSDPISNPERSMLRSFAGELRYSASVTRELKRSLDAHEVPGGSGALGDVLATRLGAPLIQVQDTLNLQAQFFVDIDERMAVDYSALPAVVRTYRQTESETAPVFLRTFYNPLGSMLAESDRGQFEKSAERMADLEGVRRATLLAAQLRVKGVDAAGMAQALDGALLRDPYTGRAFAWDSSTQSIIFQGLEAGQRGRHAVLY